MKYLKSSAVNNVSLRGGNRPTKQSLTMTEELKPKVGVGVLIVKDGKILMSRRKNAHGSGQLAFSVVI